MYSFKDYHQFKWFLGGILFVSYLWIVYHLIFGMGNGITVCPTRSILGIPCPGCGLTRAIVSFCEGNFITAIKTNPLVLVAVPFLAVAPFALAAAPKACHSYFQKTEKYLSKKPGNIILALSIATLWTYLIINNL